MPKLIHGDCLTVMRALGNFDCVFADPPDNLGLAYGECDDNLSDSDYVELLEAWFFECLMHAPILWFSVNSRWSADFGTFITSFRKTHPGWLYRHCEQVFTFGQHNKRWLGNNHRPLWCVFQDNATFYPDQVRVQSWRQRNGDKRADPRGRVPGDVFDMQYPSPGDVFDFPRVTGNSRHRCDWHPTQLHPELVERVIKFSTKETGRVLDPFAGTGTTLKVCDRIGRDCTTVDMDRTYCEKIAADLDLKPVTLGCWAR